LSVNGFVGDDEKAFDELKTAGKPENIILKPTVVKSATFNYEIIQMEVAMVDAQNVLVPDANSRIEFELKGDGEILGVCNADYTSLESYQSNSRKLYEGRCLVIIKSYNESKPIELNVKSNQLDKSFKWASGDFN